MFTPLEILSNGVDSKNMNRKFLTGFTKTKIGIAALVIASFVVGGFAFNAYQVGATEDGSGHEFGFFRGGFRSLSGIDKDSPEWEEWQAKMEEWKAKMEEFKANMPENGEWEGRGLRPGHFFGFRGMKGFATDEVNYSVQNINNGVQITITSDNPDIVKKLQERAARYNNSSE